MSKILTLATLLRLAAAEYDVIIIGAGWSGLGAAKTLKQRGITNFIVLEAHDYIGGRCKSTKIYDDVIYEEGTAYLTGIDENLVYEYGQEIGTEWVPHEYQYDTYKDGKPFPGGKTFWDYYMGIWSAWDVQYGSLNVNSSMADVINTYATELNLTTGSDEDALFSAASERVSYDYAAVLSKFNVYAGNLSGDGPGGIVIAKRGLSTIVEKYAESLLPHIKLNAQVTDINYSDLPILVTYKNENGITSTIEGSKVLVTVPFGILKAGDIQFIPAFVEAGEAGVKKQKSIDMMNPGKYEKIALFWQNMAEDEIFWDTNTEHTMHVQGDDQQGNFTHWNSYYHVNNVPYLESSASQQYVDIIETLTDKEVVAQAVERLRLYYGKEAVPEPTHYFLPRWYQEEFTKTIYAYVEPGAGFDTRENLKETLYGRLFFAGEATYEARFGTAHGALYSGIDVVGRMFPTSAPSSEPSSSTKATLAPTNKSDITSGECRQSVFLSFYFIAGMGSFLLFNLV